MARVTVEDCLQHVDNRFELVLLASKRARQLSKEGIDPLVPLDDDKFSVIALREIADNLLPEQQKTAPVKAEELLSSDSDDSENDNVGEVASENTVVTVESEEDVGVSEEE